MLLRLRATKLGCLVLTFDDGPGSRLTPLILGILKEHGVRATFFLLGRNMVGREQIIRQIFDDGHDICSHGYDHLHYWKVSPMRCIKDIKQGWEAIDAALDIERGKYPFRPPYGKLNLICLLYLWLRKVPIMFWTLDLGDTWSSEKRGRKRGAALAGQSQGAVVLAHDFDRADDDTHASVLEAVRLALATAKEKNIPVLTCSRLLGR